MSSSMLWSRKVVEGPPAEELVLLEELIWLHCQGVYVVVCSDDSHTFGNQLIPSLNSPQLISTLFIFMFQVVTFTMTSKGLIWAQGQRPDPSPVLCFFFFDVLPPCLGLVISSPMR